MNVVKFDALGVTRDIPPPTPQENFELYGVQKEPKVVI